MKHTGETPVLPGCGADARSPDCRRFGSSLCQREGVPYLGLNALRHYAGTRLMQWNLILHDVARRFGHISIKTTQTCAKWADDSLKRALEGW